MALKRAWFEENHLFWAGVLGNCFGSLRDGVFSQLTGQQQTNSSLNFATADGWTLVVVSQTWSFSGNALEDVVDERVHDAHGLAGNSGIGVYLLENFVHVDAEAFLATRPALLLAVSLDVLYCFLATFWCCYCKMFSAQQYFTWFKRVCDQ